jgi:hypothetical protein
MCAYKVVRFCPYGLAGRNEGNYLIEDPGTYTLLKGYVETVPRLDPFLVVRALPNR